MSAAVQGSDLQGCILRALAGHSSKRPARAADVRAMLGAPEQAFWAALEALVRSRQIYTAHIMRPARGETTPWLAVWPSGIVMPPSRWTSAQLTGLFVRHDPAALKKAHMPRSRPVRVSS